mgnify:CR=1 FL=1
MVCILLSVRMARGRHPAGRSTRRVGPERRDAQPGVGVPLLVSPRSATARPGLIKLSLSNGDRPVKEKDVTGLSWPERGTCSAR